MHDQPILGEPWEGLTGNPGGLLISEGEGAAHIEDLEPDGSGEGPSCGISGHDLEEVVSDRVKDDRVGVLCGSPVVDRVGQGCQRRTG